MGQKKSDGKATQGGYTWPSGDYPDGDMFRLNGWNGVIIGHVATTDTARVAGMEFDPAAIYYVKFPSGLNPAVGTYLYWTVGVGTKRGDTDLSASVQGSPVAVVEEAKNGNGYAGVRILNVGPTPAS